MYAGGLGVHVVYYYYDKRFSQPQYNENRLRLKRMRRVCEYCQGTVRVMQIVVAHDEKATVVGLIFDFDGIGFLKNRSLVLD